MSGWAIQTLVASTLLMGIVLALRLPVARSFGPRAAYALWALPALRSLMPPLPGWHMLYVPVWHIGHSHSAIGLADPVSAARLVAEPSTPLPSLVPPTQLPLAVTPHHIPFAELLLIVWVGGAVIWFGWQMLRYRHFVRSAMQSAQLLTRECGVDVLLSGHVDGPVAAGFVRRRIFLPGDFMTRYGPAERRLALLHEGAHHDRRDILANLAALAVLALHWWNPLAYRAYRAFRADQELACDATVLADIGTAERHAYGSAVLKSVSARMPGVACALSHKAELKRRLQTMARPAMGSWRRWLGVAVASSAIGAGLLVTASGGATPPAPGDILSPADIAQIRSDAEEARREGEKAAATARIEAKRAREEALRALAEERREDHRNRTATIMARNEGLRAAALARVDVARAQAAAERGRQAAELGRLRHDEAMRQIAATRQSMAAACAAKGKPVSPDLDWASLALCGDSGQAIAHRAIVEAHRGIVRSWSDDGDE